MSDEQDVSHETETEAVADETGFIPPPDLDEPTDSFLFNGAAPEDEEVDEAAETEEVDVADGEEDAESEDGEEKEAKEGEPKEKLHKIKVNGKESELTIEQLIERAQKGTAAEERMAEAASIKKAASYLIDNLKKNPLSVLTSKAVGMTEEQVTELAENLLYEKYKYENMSDVEREAHDAKKKLKTLETEKEQREREEQERELSQKTEQWEKHYNEQIVEALEGSPLPKTPQVASRVAYYMLEAVKRANSPDTPEPDKAKFRKFTAKHAEQMVREEYKQAFGSLFSNSDPEAITSLVDANAIKKLNQLSVQNYKKKQTPPSAVSGSSKKPKQKKVMTMDEWREMNSRLT